MSFGWSNNQPQGGTFYEYRWASFPRSHDNNYRYEYNDYYGYYRNNHYGSGMFDNMKGQDYHYNVSGNYRERVISGNYAKPVGSPSFKRRKYSQNSWGNGGGYYYQPNEYQNEAVKPSYDDNLVSGDALQPSRDDNLVSGVALQPSHDNSLVSGVTAPTTSSHCQTVGKRDRTDMENEDDVVFMSREEIERCSPSRKDGIDALQETRLRYSYCGFIQNLGMRLDLPQTTTGTAMVFCHRFFVRRSHACHDRFLIATAALFLAAKSEETPRPLNDVVKASCEIIHRQDVSILSYMLPIDWFEQYRERITEAEQLILTTLNFELTVQHPYDPLTSILNKLGLSQALLVDLALNLVSEGECTRIDARLMIFLAGGLICCHEVMFYLSS